MQKYLVTIPLAGHVHFEVEAPTAEEAVEKAWSMDANDGEVEWETLESFASGNVCNCPSPHELCVSEIKPRKECAKTRILR